MNGTEVKFMVDTGASLVVSEKFAQKAFILRRRARHVQNGEW